MIPGQWYAILESNEVRPGKVVGVTRMGERLVLWRDAHGNVACVSDQCPHRGVALSVGKLIGDCVECPFHGFRFDASGACTLIPANGRNAAPPKAMRARSYPARDEHGFIYIWWGEPRAEYPPIPFFDMLDESRYSASTIRDHWATHYSRAIENQLDVVHLPFVHKTTIGRGNRTLVNGPRTEMCQAPFGWLLNLWVNNEVDTGQAPLRANDIPAPTRHPQLQFIFPNLWQNWISDSFRIVVAFAPIDDANTLLYLRSYQSVARVPVARELFNWLGGISNLVIERQDKRVVVTQRPKRSDLRIGEKLIQGDGPIIEYRRKRSELIQAAGPME